jgi:RES domain-containing protein
LGQFVRVNENSIKAADDPLIAAKWPHNPVAFAAETLSLAVLEVLVHLESPVPLAAYVVFTVEYTEGMIEDFGPSLLPFNWREYPPPPAAQSLGDAWVHRGSSALLRVPSAVIPHERNLLINPAHSQFAQLLIEGPIPLDVDIRCR